MYVIGKLYKKKTSIAIMLILSKDNYCLIRNVYGEMPFEIKKTEILEDDSWEELT